MDVDVENVNLTHRSLYVGNLPYSVQWQDLKDLMRNAGNVVRADIPADYQGRSKGYGIVVMSSVDDARKAVGGCFNCSMWTLDVDVDLTLFVRF